jgi:uncharacterized protein (TIGR03437 family)
VGLKSTVCSLGFLLLSNSILHAAPTLRLSTTTIGPLAIPSAGATSAQTIDAFNAGDGSLNLTVSSSASWITANLGSSRPCRTILTAVGQTCSTIQVSISTAGLPTGLSTGIVTVSDPNAVDAPQTITVTVRVGPVSVDVAPGKTRDIEFRTSSAVASTPTPANDWLTVAGTAFGSFRFDYPNVIRFQPQASMAQGNYNGSVTIAGSSNATDNVTLPVAMRVTTQPIAVPNTEKLTIKLAEGSPALQYPFSPYVALSNAGQGTLTVSDTTVSGGSWIKKDQVPGFFIIDPTGMSAGTSTGSIAFTSNAVNSTVTVPVELQIVPKAAPLIFYQGVLDNATFVPGDLVSQGDIMVVKGEQLTFSPFTQATAVPLATKLGGTSVLVNGTAVPIFYSSYGQIAFQMPVDAPVGTAIVQVQRDDGATSNKASVEVAPRAPRLLVITNQDGSLNTQANPVKVGQAIIVWAIGLGATSPAVGTGSAGPAAEPFARVPGAMAAFGDGLNKLTIQPYFAGLSSQFPGAFQVIIVVPEDSPKGTVPLTISVGDSASNILPIYVQ